MSSKYRKKPCRFCHRWFSPDPRVGERQFACSRPECQAKRKQSQQTAWRRRNPEYFVARRLQQLPGQRCNGEQPLSASCRPPPAPSPCRPLDRLPWDLAQTQFGTQGAGFLAVLGEVLVGHVQMQLEAYLAETAGESVGLARQGAGTQSGAVASCPGEGGAPGGGAADVVGAVPDG